MAHAPLRPRWTILGFALMLAVLASCRAGQVDERGPVVLAAASLQETMEEVADVWTARGHPRPVLSFAGTPALARQIEAGAPADLVLSADEEWMDWMAQRGLVRPNTRRDLLSNRLVLIAAANQQASPWTPDLPLDEVIGGGRLAVADTAAVPAGRYARMALQQLGAWEALEPQLVPAENVRAALALVERGETPFGIVYATDQVASEDVVLLGRFPLEATPRLLYPAALLAQSDHPQAQAFLTFLEGEEARRIFRRHGFGIAP